MRMNVRAVVTGLATATALAVAAAPAGAATGPSLSKAVSDVHQANSALTQFSKYAAKKNHKKALKALAKNRAEIAAAAHQARWLHSKANATVSAAAFEAVAAQYDQDVKTYTSAVSSTTGTLQNSIAQALVPAISGRTEALGFLGELTSLLPVPGATTATNTLTGVIGNLPSEITGLTGLVSGGQLPAQIEQLIAQAITAAGSVLDAGIGELETIAPSLPTQVQPIITTLLGTLKSTLGTVMSTLTGTTGSIGGLLGGTIGSELGEVTSILQGILGDLPILGGTTGGSGTGTGGLGSILGTLGGTGTGTGTGTSTGGILGALPFGLGSLLSGLLGTLGISLPGI